MPEENTKSAPQTEKMAAGNPKAQYGDVGSITAKRRAAVLVMAAPTAEDVSLVSKTV